MRNPDFTQNTQAQASPDCSRKAPYEQPKLIEYGDVSTLTQHVGGHGNLDGGHRGLTPLRSSL
jgi:hypothetical protein